MPVPIYCFSNAADGGHAKVEAGINLGMVFPMWKKLWSRISSKEGLLFGSRFKISYIRFLASSEIVTWSGNE